MKKLTPELVKRHDELYGKLSVAWEKIDQVVVHINDMIERQLSDAIVEYNEIIKEAVEFRDEVVAKMDEYIDTRPEGWIEKEEGELYAGWKDAWECADLEPIGHPEVIQVEGQDTADDFGNLDTEPR